MYSVKTALRESFDEIHGGSFAFIEEEGFKPLRPVGDLGEKSV